MEWSNDIAQKALKLTQTITILDGELFWLKNNIKTTQRMGLYLKSLGLVQVRKVDLKSVAKLKVLG